MSELPLSFFNSILRESSPLATDGQQASIARGRCSLLGMPLNAVTESEALEILEERIERNQGTWVLTPNLDILRHYFFNPSLRYLFDASKGGADLLLADGMPLIWASKLAGRPLPERVPGSTLAVTLAQRAAARRWSIFLLGGSPGAAERAAETLRQRFCGVKIAGTACPLPSFEKDPAQLAALRAQVVAAKPTIIYVALGFPKQEFVIQYLRPALPNATFIGVGISLSFIAGDIRRAPRWVQSLGLEWLHRLVQEPRRLARRYLVHDAPFALLHLFPRAIAARWNVPGRSEPLLEHQMSPAELAALRKPARTPPADSRGTDVHEGNYPGRRPGHTPESPDQSDQQASPPRLRQAHDHVPDRVPA